MISVIIPLYNKEQSIYRCINSVLSQSFKDTEVIVVDDGSTDDSATIVKHFSDERVVYCYKKNGGVSRARNYGLTKCSGDYIIFLDADDYLLEGAIDLLWELLQKSKVDIATGNYYAESSDRRKLKLCMRLSSDTIFSDNLKAYYWGYFGMRMGCALISKSVLPPDPFSIKYSRYEDIQLIIELCKICKIASSPKPVMVYTSDAKSLSKPCVNPANDYAMNITFKGTSFYEKMILGQILTTVIYCYNLSFHDLYTKYHYFVLYIYIACLGTKIKHIMSYIHI